MALTNAQRQKRYREKHRYDVRYKQLRKIRNHAYYHSPLAEFCELCPNRATERHHPDYNYPEIIVSVCAECHKWVHKNKLKKRYCVIKRQNIQNITFVFDIFY